MSIIRQSLLALGLWAWVGCSAAGDSAEEPTPTVPPAEVQNPNNLPEIGSVLFIGNSLTATNNLPGLVRAEGERKGVYVRTKAVAIPNSALEDHWFDGTALELIRSEHFDFVVVQQGPSSQEEGRQMLLEYGKRFKDVCDQNQAKLAFYMVWPAIPNYSNFGGVIKNYTDAADATKSLLCPVGSYWKAYIDRTGDFSYYSGDQFHPSKKGSTLAAEIIYKTLFP
jgi:hypothetical protein